jgi:hypothetical protein
MMQEMNMQELIEFINAKEGEFFIRIDFGKEEADGGEE